jgi:hypothetical protein
MDYRLYAIADQDNFVINVLSLGPNEDISTVIENVYSSRYHGIEYSEDKSVTNSQAFIGSTYNENLNAFIPKKPNPTYILNEDTYVWEPDPNLEYEINNDGIMYKWNGNGWVLFDSNNI